MSENQEVGFYKYVRLPDENGELMLLLATLPDIEINALHQYYCHGKAKIRHARKAKLIDQEWTRRGRNFWADLQVASES